MTPKLLSMVEAIACTAPEVNVVFTGDERNAEGQFAVFQRMRKALREMAERAQIPYQEHGIPEKYRRDVSPPRVNLTVCSDFYAEAETAAVRITELVREKGLRYRDIVIICNDAEVRGSIFRRVFDRYEIPLFIDRKRGILQDPAVEFIFAMMDTVRDGRRFYDVFRMMKIIKTFNLGDISFKRKLPSDRCGISFVPRHVKRVRPFLTVCFQLFI